MMMMKELLNNAVSIFILCLFKHVSLLFRSQRLQKANDRKAQELTALRQEKAAADDQLGELLDDKDAAIKVNWG